jgi:CIC family chloride channel protein
MLGTTVGSAFGIFFPSITAPASAYGVVGMAAVFAGAARAPFSAILIIFEMTGNYSIILPLMTAVVISTVVSRVLSHETIYTLKLLRRGVDIEQEEMADVMRTVTVREAMTRNFPTVPVEMKIDGLIRLFQKTGHHGFPVVDKNGLLGGVVTQTDLERQLGATSVDRKLTAGDIATKHSFVAYPDQYLDRLLDSIDEAEARIPVVSRDDSQRLLGVLGRHEIISVYRRKARRRVLRTVQR